MSDFLFRGKLADLDPDVFDLTQLEAERQTRKLILIPSESTAPYMKRRIVGATDLLSHLITKGRAAGILNLLITRPIAASRKKLIGYSRPYEVFRL